MAKFCGSCGAQSADDAKFCEACGAPLEESAPQAAPSPKFCGSCGAQSPADAKICGTCGAPLEAGSSSASIPGLQYMDPEKKAMIKKYGILAGSIAVVVIVAILAFNIISGFLGYKGVIRKFINAMEDGNAAALVETLSAYHTDKEYWEDNDIEESFDEEISDMLVQLEDQLGGVPSLDYEITKVSEWSDSKLKKFKKQYEDCDWYDVDDISKAMTVKLKLTAKADDDETTNRTELELVKEDGSWKIFTDLF